MLTGRVGRTLALTVLCIGGAGWTTSSNRLAHSYKLDRPLADLLVNHAFYDWVTGANGPEFATGSSPAYPRRCKNTLPCEKKKARTNVLIRPAVEAHDLDLDHIPDKGVVVAYMQQDATFGKFTEYLYNTPPGPDRVYIVVEPGTTPGTGHWTAVQVNAAGSTPLSDGVYYRCPTSHPRDPDSFAGFGGCPTNAPEVNKKLTEIKGASNDKTRMQLATELKRFFPFDPYDDSPAWMSCIHGCCTAEQ